MSLQFFWPLSEGGKMITVAPGITSTFQAKGRRRKLEFRGSFIDIFPFIRKVSVNFPSKDAAMKTEEPTPSLGQTLEWLRKELAEMQVQDQRLLLTLRHLHSVLQELRTESAPWEDARSSGGTSPRRARAGSESRGRPPISSQGLAQLLQGTDSRRSSLP
nr:uncharacterized protein C20orf202 homolog isoform X1 [Halichoerus grypus]